MIEDRMDAKIWSNETWNYFISEYWEKAPIGMAGPEWANFCSMSELFQVMLKARFSRRLESDRFWVARKGVPKSRKDFVLVDLDLLGPQNSDGDLNGFFARMEDRCFGINLHRLERWHPRLRDRLLEPIDRLSQTRIAGRVSRWDLDCFLGNYRMTPFGVHKDKASVFSWCLQGERTYLTWPPEYPWPQEHLHTPDESRLSAHLEAAERFTIRSGELFYWPSNRWHVVCSDGQPSVVVQFSAYFS